ncbi:MAG TPA: hypothetical protein VHS06_02270, partial [Chloroflexota bacterium]|nr:hypothetical protein [Chloroflexota bacterium]
PASSGRVAEQVDALGGEVSIWAHAIGALFVAEMMPTSGMIERVTALRGVAEAAGGYLVVENWVAQPGLKPWPGDVWGRPGGPLALMQAIKREYDPRRTINPGRFVGGI